MTRWGMTIDLRRCVGCQTCTIACKQEHGLPAGTAWRFVADCEVGEYPDVRRLFLPMQCMHCAEPPCVPVCPTGASRQREDGIVWIHYDACVGCGYCVVACPYGARYLIPAGASSPMGSAGVADKCTWCYQRISAGREPACVEICPVGARVFGDLADPDSPIQAIVDQPGVSLLRPDLGTEPRVYYVGLESEVA